MKIITVDLGLYRPHFASCHLLLAEDGSCALVDVGARANAPRILKALEQNDVAPTAVSHVFVTHVHLDHAGGAGYLLESALPQAQLVVHPKGAAHMRDPSRLEAGARAVYGDEEYDRSYGALVPVPPERMIVAPCGGSLSFGGVDIEVWDTPGHARHHYSLFLPSVEALFTGDTFGLAYPELTVNGQPFVFPTTTPTAFEPDALEQSLQKLADSGAQTAYLTHYGALSEPSSHQAALVRRLRKLVELTEGVRGLEKGVQEQSLMKSLRTWVGTELQSHGIEPEFGLGILHFDLLLNVQGLLHWLRRSEK